MRSHLFVSSSVGRKKDGLVVDLSEMTYEEVSCRLLELFHPASRASRAGAGVSPWIDITYFMKFKLWVLQVFGRFKPDLNEHELQGLNDMLQYQAPVERVMEYMRNMCPEHVTELLSPEDEDFFLGSVCMLPGKPVNFVPLIDENFKIWMKKDSLWFSEDLSSVPNQDVQRVAILHSPVSVKFSQKANESVKAIMDGIHTGLVELIREESNAAVAAGGDPIEVEHQLDDANTLEEDAWSPEAIALKTKFTSTAPSFGPASNIHLAIPIDANKDELSSIRPEVWYSIFSSSGSFWVRSLFSSGVILRSKQSVSNYIRPMFLPRPGTRMMVTADRVLLWDDALLPDAGIDQPTIEIQFDGSNANTIRLNIANPKQLTNKPPSTHVPTIGEPIPVSTLRLSFTLVKGEYQYRTYGLLLEQPWTDKVKEITRFYRELWLDPAASSSAPVSAAAGSNSSAAASSGHQITSAELLRFISATSDETVHEMPDGRTMLVPLDYTLCLAWSQVVEVMINAAESIRGDLLALVHLSNEYIVPEESAPLIVGDIVHSRASVTGLWIEPEGQVITVRAEVSRASSTQSNEKHLAVTIISRFAIRTATGSEPIEPTSEVWFRETEGAYILPSESLHSKTERAILLSKTWHNLSESQLTPGAVDSIIFRFQVRETPTGTTTTGLIFGRKGGVESRIGSIDHRLPIGSSRDTCPVMAYAKRKCKSEDEKPELIYETPQNYAPSIIVAPNSNKAYAIASKDCNVIHLNPYLIPLASLPTTITHGMYSSARMRQAISESSGASGVLHGGARIVSYKAEFRGMVHPGSALKLQLHLVGMNDGRKSIVGEMRTVADDTLVLRGTALVQQSPVAYLFTGQGSAQVNMGMELYATSSVAKDVWNEAESFLRETYGFSILEIVKNNPKTLTVSFEDTPAGREMKRRYLALGLLKMTSTGEDNSSAASMAEVASRATDAELARLPNSYTYLGSEGLLYATQFQQPAILLQETAAFVDLRSRGLVQSTAKLAGHSLGEYCTLAACLQNAQIAPLAEVVFLRGLTMQNAVSRDALGRSRYGMVAASPDRVGSFYTESQLSALVLALESETKELLQVVNFNVYNSQYVIAGGLVALESLRLALDALKKLGRKPEGGELASIVLSASSEAIKKGAAAKDGYLPATRGQATIPLAIDVPFHSKQLSGGVPAFRQILRSTFARFPVRAKELVGKYVPNVLGQTFSLKKDYLTQIHTATGSEVMANIIDTYTEAIKNQDELCRDVVVELLSYQFASAGQHTSTSIHNVRDTPTHDWIHVTHLRFSLFSVCVFQFNGSRLKRLFFVAACVVSLRSVPSRLSHQC